MDCHISLRNGVVYMQTMGKMGKGFYRGVEPVDVVPVKNTESLRQALKGTIARGNPSVPQPQRRDDWPPPVVLKYAGVKSWPAFERGRQVWNLEEMTVFIGSPAIPRVFMGGWKFRSKQ
jgi:hypothetical protein